jgi:hypothetical protein
MGLTFHAVVEHPPNKKPRQDANHGDTGSNGRSAENIRRGFRFVAVFRCTVRSKPHHCEGVFVTVTKLVTFPGEFFRAVRAALANRKRSTRLPSG